MSDDIQTGSGAGVSTSQLRRMLAAREKHAKVAALEKEAKAEKVAAELEVHEAMEGNGDTSVTRDVGPPWGKVSFTANATIRGDIYDEEAFIEWAERQGFEKAMLGKPQPRKQAINQYVRRALKSKGDLPEGVEHHRTRYVTVKHK